MASQILIHLPALAACIKCASTDRTRAYLNGVYVNWREGQTVIVATDGHILCKAQPSMATAQSVAKLLGFQPAEHEGVIVHVEDVKRLLKWLQKSAIAAVDYALLEADGSKLTFTSWNRSETIKTEAISATYPDYERVMPKEGVERAATPVGLNARHLVVVRDVAKAGFAHSRSLCVEANLFGASNPTVWKMRNPSGDQACVVIMPMRV